MRRELVLVGFGLLVWLALCCAPLTGMYVESNKRAAADNLKAVGLNTLAGMTGVVNSAMSPMVAAARFVEKFVGAL